MGWREPVMNYTPAPGHRDDEYEGVKETAITRATLDPVE